MATKTLASARELIAAGKLDEAEALLRGSQDAWSRIHLADLLLLRAPFDEKKVEEACSLYEAASDDLPQLAAASIDRARSMLAAAPDVLVEKLQEHFGFSSFRPGQREIVQAVLKGRHALAIQQTGKSILHELPAVLLEGETVRVPGDVTPDRPVDLVVVENAQRVSEWSPDFSPEYLKIRDTIIHLHPKSVLALAPFAAPRVRVEIQERLGLQNPVVHVGSVDRPNVFLGVEKPADRMGALVAAIRATQGLIVVFAQNRDEVLERLRSAGIAATTEPSDWHRGVLVAGPGFRTDFREVRAVFHLQYPASIEEYWEQISCVGKDGQPAVAGVFFDPADRNYHRALLDERFPSREAAAQAYALIRDGRGDVSLQAAELLERHGIVRRTANGWEPMPGAPSLQRVDLSEMERRRGFSSERLRAIEAYLEGRACRRRAILEYFGEKLPPNWRCSGCDRCRAGASQDTQVRTPEAKQAILDSVRELESRRMTLKEMSRAILFLGKPLKGVTETDVREILTQLVKDGLVEVNPQGQWLKLKR